MPHVLTREGARRVYARRAYARRVRAVVMGLCTVLLGAGTVSGDPAPAAGCKDFPRTTRRQQLQLEARFDSNLSAADLRSWMEQLSSAPNHVGSAHDKANAEFLLRKFREWGWDASIEEFSVLYPTPREEVVELVGPTHFVAALREPPVPGDATSQQVRDELPPYNVYGADGDVTADLVYVNQGMPDDYKELEREGVSVKGTHRHCPLWRWLARPQAEARVRAWRGGLPHLFRSAR
jgi:N-acetylated-alpha-linked acidic dipeptidase